MQLDEFRQKEKEDSNLFWRLSEGERQNLLDEAIDRIEEYEKALNNSPFDIGICPSCRRPIIILPDGLPRMCSHCKQNGAKYHARGEE